MENISELVDDYLNTYLSVSEPENIDLDKLKALRELLIRFATYYLEVKKTGL